MTEDAAEAALRRLVLDWQTIWHSEVQALAGDGELHDALEAAVRAAAAFHSAAASSTGADAPPRPSPAAAAPDARGDAIRRLEQRVAELERRLDGHPGRDG